MKTYRQLGFLVLCTILVYTTSVQADSDPMTIATFDDPAVDSSTPLFEVNLNEDLIFGGWPDSQTNLDLEIVCTGHIFNDAYFEMTPVSYTGDIMGGTTGSGTIKFFADGDSNSLPPLIQIDFDSANVSLTGFGALELFAINDVTISGSEITCSLSNEAFAFTFANQILLPSDGGYTATAAFTSSAVPEPATLVLLGLGASITLTRRKGKSV